MGGCAISRRRIGAKGAIQGIAQLLALAAAGTVGILILAGCGGGSSSGALSITISPTSASVGLNSQEDFTAVVKNATSATNTAVTWEVNGTAGGSSVTGTIVSSGTNSEVGVYTAPSSVPSTDNGVVSVTAVIQETSSSNSSNTTTITSNTATVTIGGGAGLLVSPATITVPGGSTTTFSATLNGLADTSVTWAVSSANGGTIGTIDPNNGTFTAPSAPPPGGTVTITATDTTNPAHPTASATATIAFSDQSFLGPFAFSFTGNDRTGFSSVAGSLVADGSGNIEGGVEDLESFTSSVTSQVPITGGNYAVGPDGRGTAVLTSSAGNISLAFVIASGTAVTHADVIRMDNFTNGSGAMDQQNLNDLTLSAISGPYVFSALGATTGFLPLGIAGKFTANGGGTIPQTASIVDVNNDGSVTAADTTLQGSYAMDNTFPGTGRGTLTLTSNAAGQRTFAFYIVDNTHLKLVGADTSGFLAGEVFSGPTATLFSAASLASGNYAYTAGGTTSTGAYAAGGIFASDGNGNATSKFFDANNAGKLTNDTGAACGYAVDPATGRIDLRLFVASGACPAGVNGDVIEFAGYQTLQGSIVLLELNSAAVSSGLALQQQSSVALPDGSFGLILAGPGIVHENVSAIQPSLTGHLTLSGASATAGSLDINNVSAAFPNDPISTSSTTFGSPATGRGTATISASDPVATFKLVYYLVDSNTVLFVGQDTNRVVAGGEARQF